MQAFGARREVPEQSRLNIGRTAGQLYHPAGQRTLRLRHHAGPVDGASRPRQNCSIRAPRYGSLKLAKNVASRVAPIR